MALQLVQANVKARDHAAVGRFWAAALGWEAFPGHGGTSVRPAGSGWPVPAVVCLDVIPVHDVRTVADRTHLELASTSAAHHAELVARLTELGATPAEAARDDLPWTVLADPEGNAFCVREPRAGHQDTGPLAALAVDCTDVPGTAEFWGDALGWTVHASTDDRALLRSPARVGPYLELLRTPHLATGGHRVHLDLLPDPVDDQAAEVARLLALGATPADVGQGDVPWQVLADPEGNQLCVLGRA